ncbi:MAG: tRNA lysidine(34) synthetase TilS, partial [Desulfovibrio sp.]|nr:tRNA lysidine(34) synthetase TilS [Desulfovibrio sp.]
MDQWPSLSLPTLPKDLARFCLDCERNLRALGLSHTHLLLALSGGADSTALACLLHVLRQRLSLTLSALLCDHGLRKEVSEEIEGVRRLTRWLSIPLSVCTLDVTGRVQKTNEGFEEAGRKERYKALEKERKRLGASFIVTAHQADDLAEDILMRLCRGTGWPGLGGMPALDAKRHLVRPLLDIPAKRLRFFLKRLDIPWFE